LRQAKPLVLSTWASLPRKVAESPRGLRPGENVAQQLVEIHRRENETDRVVRAVASLLDTSIDPIVIRWKDIYDTLKSAVDACEAVADVLEGITLERAANGTSAWRAAGAWCRPPSPGLPATPRAPLP
jgi:uncharacterized protein